MGWWSKTVLGGDTPMDYIGDLEHIAGLTDEDEDLTKKQVKAKITSNLIKLFAHAKKVDEDEDFHYKGIMPQVFGVLVCSYGVPITIGMKNFILEGIKNDEWSRTDKNRLRFMNHFKRQIKRYKLTGSQRGIQVASESLLDAINSDISEGKIGLVNKNL